VVIRFFPVLVFCTKKNLATLPQQAKKRIKKAMTTFDISTQRSSLPQKGTMQTKAELINNKNVAFP
jgi:hypothetical protein